MAEEPIDAVVQLLRERFSVPAKTIEEVRQRFEQLADDLPSAEVPATLDGVDADGVPALWVSTAEAERREVILFLHGGGYNCGSTYVYTDFMTRLSHACGARVLGIDYRLAPEHKFPAAVDDAVVAYRWLLTQFEPRQITFVGDSAGGGLVLCTLVALRDAGDPLPARAICLSPWTDLEGLGESVKTKDKSDPWIRGDRITLSSRLYLQENDYRNPLAAPLHADPTGLPPLLILVGSEETLLDDSTRFAEKAQAAGVDVTLEIWDGMIHVWPFFAGMLPEGALAFQRMGGFIHERAAAPRLQRS